MAFLVPADAQAQAFPSANPSRSHGSGPLYEEIARSDSIFFDALFAQCDADSANALLTSDVEFYDDRTGFTSGDEVRQGFQRLAENCPADNGVRRILLPSTMGVYPIEGFGAMQTGTHHFVERGASNSTIATFVIVWHNEDGGWKMARVMSVDHQSVDAAHAAELRNLRASP